MCEYWVIHKVKWVKIKNGGLIGLGSLCSKNVGCVNSALNSNFCYDEILWTVRMQN